MSEIIDFLIIGSGPSAAEVARTIAEKGQKATIIDVGFRDNNNSNIPNEDFLTIRHQNKNQKELFLGNEYEAIPWGNIKTGVQLTPNRKFIIQNVDKITPIISENFSPMESLAYGGLGSGWGLGCYEFSKEEIEKVGLDYQDINKAYKNVAKNIGIAKPIGDTQKYCTNNPEVLFENLQMDNSLSILYNTYLKKKTIINEKGLFMGYPPLAIITQNKDDRKKCNYCDTEFYSDENKHAYRPWLTINKLIQQNAINYIPNTLATEFYQDTDGIVSVKSVNVKNLNKTTYKCRRLIIASGALGTARILLRSFKNQISETSLLSNEYTYMPCLNLKMIGKPLNQFKTSMAQAVMFYDPAKNSNAVSIALFSYRSLLLYKLVKEAPLNFKNGLKIMNLLQSAFVIAGIHHPDNLYSQKKCSLKTHENPYTKDALNINFLQTQKDININKDNETQIMKIMRKLYCFPIKRINPGSGSSIHYGGVLPFNTPNNGITLNAKGNLNVANNVYIADGTGFKFLPAKGITFTLMANAQNVAINATKY